MARVDELKTKYRPALEAMTQGGVQINQITLRDDKLYVEGFAPTQEAKNAAWNQIKAIDSSYSDLTCDLKVGPPNADDGLTGASPQSIAGGLAAAFRSDQTPDFGNMLSNLFNHSDRQQRAGVLNQILSAAGPSLLGGALPPQLASLLRGGSTVTPEQAESISPEAVQDLAHHAQKADPSIIDQVSGFYAQHPKVIQALGAGALAMVMTHMNKKQ